MKLAAYSVARNTRNADILYMIRSKHVQIRNHRQQNHKSNREEATAQCYDDAREDLYSPRRDATRGCAVASLTALGNDDDDDAADDDE